MPLKTVEQEVFAIWSEHLGHASAGSAFQTPHSTTQPDAFDDEGQLEGERDSFLVNIVLFRYFENSWPNARSEALSRGNQIVRSSTVFTHVLSGPLCGSVTSNFGFHEL